MSAHAARPPRACSRWRPAALVTTDVVAIKLWLGVDALVRAADYAHGVRDHFPMLESAFPMAVWVTWAFAVGACILTGIAWQLHVLVWLGHALGAGLYGILTITSFASAFERWPALGVITLAVPNPVWATALAALGAALGIGALTARGPLRPASWAAAVLGLIVISAAGALANAPADGIRGAGPIALAALVHTVLALRSSPRPLASDEATVVERTTAPEGQ